MQWSSLVFCGSSVVVREEMGKEKGNLRTSVAAVALLVEPANRHLGALGQRCCFFVAQ